VLQGIARACKTRIDKAVSFPACTTLHRIAFPVVSEWCQCYPAIRVTSELRVEGGVVLATYLSLVKILLAAYGLRRTYLSDLIVNSQPRASLLTTSRTIAE
jgi:hypothetical protein